MTVAKRVSAAPDNPAPWQQQTEGAAHARSNPATRPATSASSERDDPTIVEPTDAIIRLSATCVCGSDLWPYRGIEAVDGPSPMGHEYVGIVEEVGSDVRTIKPGQFVIGSFFASDNTCEICRAGYQSSLRAPRSPWAPSAPRPSTPRVPLADGTLVATPEHPVRRPDPEPARRLRRARHRLVRRRRRRGRARQDRRRRRGRRGRPARRCSPPGSSAPSGSSP